MERRSCGCPAAAAERHVGIPQQTKTRILEILSMGRHSQELNGRPGYLDQDYISRFPKHVFSELALWSGRKQAF